MRSPHARIRIMSLVLFMMTFPACGIPTPALLPVSPTPLPPMPTAVPVTETFTPLPLPSPTLVPTATVTPLNLNPQVLVLAEDFLEPDDLVLAPDGSIFISDVTAGVGKQYTQAGTLNVIVSGLGRTGGRG